MFGLYFWFEREHGGLFRYCGNPRDSLSSSSTNPFIWSNAVKAFSFMKFPRVKSKEKWFKCNIYYLYKMYWVPTIMIFPVWYDSIYMTCILSFTGIYSLKHVTILKFSLLKSIIIMWFFFFIKNSLYLPGFRKPVPQWHICLESLAWSRMLTLIRQSPPSSRQTARSTVTTYTPSPT